MTAMRINTNYERSISFRPQDEEKMLQHEEIHVHLKSTGELLGVVYPHRVLQDAKHVYYTNHRTGERMRSPFKVFSW